MRLTVPLLLCFFYGSILRGKTQRKSLSGTEKRESFLRSWGQDPNNRVNALRRFI
jgi:hypothetical protein